MLGDEHWQIFCMRREHLKHQKHELKEAREAFSSYTNLLRIADLRAGRNESINNKRQHMSWNRTQELYKRGKKDIDSEAEKEYEEALERLDEILSGDPTLVRFLDRDWTLHDKAENNAITPFKLGIPRLVFYKKNVYGKAEDNVYMSSLYNIKCQTLREAISNPYIQNDIKSESTNVEGISKTKSLLKYLNELNDIDEM